MHAEISVYCGRLQPLLPVLESVIKTQQLLLIAAEDVKSKALVTLSFQKAFSSGSS